MTLDPLNTVLIGVILLLAVGFYGLLITRNLIKIVLVLQILVKAVVIALVLAGKASGHIGLGQSMAATVIVADTIVAVVALALAVQVRIRFGTLDLSKISSLRGWYDGNPGQSCNRHSVDWGADPLAYKRRKSAPPTHTGSCVFHRSRSLVPGTPPLCYTQHSDRYSNGFCFWKSYFHTRRTCRYINDHRVCDRFPGCYFFRRLHEG